MPPGFLPVAAVLASRAASLASYSAISRAWRVLARTSIFVRASVSRGEWSKGSYRSTEADPLS